MISHDEKYFDIGQLVGDIDQPKMELIAEKN